jgi:quercetin dioxygenase-like cupin family protein
MKRTVTSWSVGAAFVAAAVVAAWTGGLAQGQMKQGANKEPLYVSSAKAKFTDMMPGVSQAIVWGDPDKGAYGTFTKFVPGYDAGMHTHTNDVSIVVIKGAYLYKDASGEKRVGAGDFLRVPGGWKHWSGGDKTEGALFYTEGRAKFDLVPTK